MAILPTPPNKLGCLRTKTCSERFNNCPHGGYQICKTMDFVNCGFVKHFYETGMYKNAPHILPLSYFNRLKGGNFMLVAVLLLSYIAKMTHVTVLSSSIAYV